jgi:peptide deformylase
MATRNILTLGDETLRKKCRTVTAFDRKLFILLEDMAETLHKAEGVGLAAPQIGVLRRVVVIDVGNGIVELVNPEVVKTKGVQETSEGCLSVPGKYGITKRPAFVTVKAQDRHGKEFTMNGEELLAKAFCHEIDHLDGKLFIDIVIRMLDPKELED